MAENEKNVQQGIEDGEAVGTAVPATVEEETPSRSKFRTLMIIIALYMVMFIAALDQTVVATAIPTITHDLHSAAGYTWIGGAYFLASASCGTIWVKCSDIWGRKPLILVAVFVFAVASLIAALSIDMPMLIAARALQGVGSGGLMQLVAVAIADMFSLRDRSFYFGIMGAVWAIAGGAGPLIGGAFAEYVTWRWCFWINLPVCGLAELLLFLFLDLHNPRTPLRKGLAVVDWWGSFSILAVVIMILLGLNLGGATFSWSSSTVICLLVFGSASIALFLYSELRLARYPLMPLSAFRRVSNTAVIIVAFGHSMVATGTEFYLPLYFQSVQEASPLRSGVLLLPYVLAAAAADFVGGLIIHRTGKYLIFLQMGCVLMTLGTGLYINFWTHTPLGQIIGFQIIAAVGMALLFQTPMLAVQNSVHKSDVASATSTLSFLRSLASSLAVVIGGSIFQNSINTRASALAAAGLSGSLQNSLNGGNAAANVEIIRNITNPTQLEVVKEAYAYSTRRIFIFFTAIAGLTLLASPFIRQGYMSKEHSETKTGLNNLSEREKTQPDVTELTAQNQAQNHSGTP
ncbi:hypothetical protein GX50_00963 [[Emmonsia] crescens]|uniref:Major facilitator superfamily (MFS) profile domain-containing protein n=1 Tax=[Emmonsia] crescens TaxID=73230 RepID=A0A2B7ZSV2_9EURO|nr:hypothetical protein GX50_00963 [Emmonsia crescens]